MSLARHQGGLDLRGRPRRASSSSSEAAPPGLSPAHRAILQALIQTPTLPIDDPEHLRRLLPAHAARWALPSMLAYLQRANLTDQLANGSWTLSPELGWRLEDRRTQAALRLEQPH